MEKILAIDYGSRRFGLAVSDPLGISGRPLPALERAQGDTLEEVVAGIGTVAREEEVSSLVVGLPLKMDGTEGPAAREVRDFIKRLKRLGLPVFEEDERLSSRHAHAVLKSHRMSARRRKQLVDSAAALLLLQSFLARRRSSV